MKSRYRENSKGHKQNVALNKATRTLVIQEKMCQYLLEHPCVDCGTNDIRVLEADHIVDNKLANVSKMLANRCS